MAIRFQIEFASMNTEIYRGGVGRGCVDRNDAVVFGQACAFRRRIGAKPRHTRVVDFVRELQKVFLRVIRR